MQTLSLHTQTHRDTHTHTHTQNGSQTFANLLEGKKGENIDNVGYSNDSLVIVPKAGSVKERIIKLDFIKVKKIFSVKDILKRMMRQAIDWEKIFAKYISKIYKNS